MADSHPISVERLRQLIRLDPATGLLYWLPRDDAAFNGRLAGKEALSALNRDGYKIGLIFRRNYQAHRVAFALHYGRWPGGQIDHVNGDKDDNRPENLREATRSQNMRNRPGYGTSTFRGVTPTGYGTWRAAAKVCGQRHDLGSHPTEVDAALAYDEFARRHYGEFAHLNFP